MLNEYESVYKCRLCGETYIAGAIRLGDTKAVTFLCQRERDMFGMTGVHFCEDGSFGIADLQGLNLRKETP